MYGQSSNHPFFTKYSRTAAGYESYSTPSNMMTDDAAYDTPPATPYGPVSPYRQPNSYAPEQTAYPTPESSDWSYNSNSSPTKAARREAACYGGGGIGFGSNFENFPSAAQDESYADAQSTTYTDTTYYTDMATYSQTTEEDEELEEPEMTEAQRYAAAARRQVPHHYQSVENFEVEVEDIYAGYFNVSSREDVDQEEVLEDEEENEYAGNSGNKYKDVSPSPIRRSDKAYDTRQYEGKIPRCNFFGMRG